MKNIDVFENYKTSINGLTTEEVKLRQKKHGKNELKKTKRPNSIVVYLKQFNDWLVIILIIAAISSMLVDHNNLIESSIIMAILLLNASIGTFQEIKAFKTLDSLNKLSIKKVTVVRDGITEVIDSTELVIGDIVLVNKGDYISADMILIEAYEVKVDESVLTGESIPVLKETNDLIHSATFLVAGKGKAIVTHIGMNTKLGEIAYSLLESNHDQTPLEVKLEQIGKIIGIIAIIICGIVFLIELALKITPLDAFKSAVSLAVAAIPEGLATVVTVCLALGVKKMANENAIIKKLEAVETLGCSNIVCTDKTGTLTENKQTVVDLYINKREKNNNMVNYFLPFCYITANPTNENGNSIIDPIDKSIVDYCQKEEIIIPTFKLNYVEPFDSTKKYMSVSFTYKNNYYKIYKGAFDVLEKKISSFVTNELVNVNQKMMENGYRVIALANSENILGLIAMEDRPRSDVLHTIQVAKQANVRTIMITGDHPETAFVIAKRLGIAKEKGEAISKQQLDLLTDQELERNISNYSVYARVNPADKVRIVKAWQKNNCVVAMTGDGINDAPALKAADIGCAMGNGTDVAKDASDMILVDSNYKTIIESIKNGRAIYENIKKCTKYLLASNIGEVLTIVIVTTISLITGNNLGIPLASIHLLWINIITDSLPAFGLGVEKASSELMQKPPRVQKENFFANGLGWEICYFGISIGLLTVISYFIGLRINPLIAPTMAFVTISTSQLFHAINCKSKRSIFRSNIFNNTLLNASFIVGLILELVVIYVKPLNTIFKLYPLGVWPFLISFALAFSIVFISELWKKFTIQDPTLMFYMS